MTAVLSLPGTHFELPIEMIVLGLVVGLIYGLLGIGLALVYRTARVLNFAHGESGALATSVMVVLILGVDVPYPVGLLGGIAAAVVAGLLLERLVIRRLADAPRLVVMVATIGASQILLAFNAFLPREDYAAERFPVPFDVSLTVGAVRLGTGELMVLAIAPMVAVAIATYLRRSKLGLGARAAAENLEAAVLAGAPAARISRFVWVLAALLSASSAILLAPTQSIATTQSLGPSLMVKALAAALIGGMASFPQIMAGGAFVGVVQLLVGWNYPSSGIGELLVLGTVLASVMLRRNLRRSGRDAEATSWSLGGAVRALDSRLANHPRLKLARRLGAVALLAAAIVLPLSVDSSKQVLFASVLVFTVIALSVTVLTGYAGQVSLAQYTFVGIGAVVGGRIAELGYPEWVGIVYAVAAAGLAAVVIGLPALRLRGLFLAVTTLAFAVAAEAWIPRQRWLVHNSATSTSTELPRHSWLGVDLTSERNYYYLCLLLCVAAIATVAHVRRTSLGRALMAVRDNELAAMAASVSPRRVKVTAFAISGMLAGLGGYVYAGLLVNFGSAGVFSPSSSLTLVSVVILGGVTTVTGAVLGAAWTRLIPYLFGTEWAILSSGIGVLIVLLFVPGGLASLAMRVRDVVVRRLTGETPTTAATGVATTTVPRVQLPPAAPIDADEAIDLTELPLRADRITLSFGGLRALDDVTVELRRGEILGLVGPNGAGKTTLFDVLAGQLRPDAGRVLLGGIDVTGLRPEERALLGLGRSFQEARLFPEMSVFDALRVALETSSRFEAFPAVLGLPSSRADERVKHLRADELVDLLSLGRFAGRNCGELSTGTRRFVELGMLVAMGADVVLLDEPTAGIAQREVESFMPVLRSLRDHLDASIVLIDHDMPMMTVTVDRVYVLAAGAVIAEGPPTVLRDDPAVIAAYLGTDERVIARSGSMQPVAARPARRRTTPLRADQ